MYSGLGRFWGFAGGVFVYVCIFFLFFVCVS